MSEILPQYGSDEEWAKEQALHSEIESVKIKLSFLSRDETWHLLQLLAHEYPSLVREIIEEKLPAALEQARRWQKAVA